MLADVRPMTDSPQRERSQSASGEHAEPVLPGQRKPVTGVPLQRLRLAFIGSCLGFVALLEWVRFELEGDLATWPARLLMDALVLTGFLVLFGVLFEIASRMQQRVERQSQELMALHRAALDIYGEPSLSTVLQKVVEQACQLLEARYGAVSVVDGDNEIQEFVTHGVSAERRAEIGDPPEGRGLLGVVLHEGHRLRLADLTRDPRATGFPPHHPKMRSLLAVPITCKGPFSGNLYLSEKIGGPEFTTEDEETLVRFATEAAIAIDNAYLHERLRALAISEERLRIAREMHDGMAQVLAYVNTKAQAVKEYLRQERLEEAGHQLEQLAGAARDVYTDTREGILALRTPAGPERSLGEAVRHFLERWEEQSGIRCTLATEGRVELDPAAELQLLRIVQESLSNVRKHSGADSVRVLLDSDHPGNIRVIIEDDGLGFDPEARSREGFPRFGLAVMRERAESIGGSFTIESTPGVGTRLTIEVPPKASTY